jgi:hypothetical protein
LSVQKKTQPIYFLKNLKLNLDLENWRSLNPQKNSIIRIIGSMENELGKLMSFGCKN